MKNVFVIFILFTCILQSCTDKPKKPTVDFTNATFISDQDIMEVIQLNEDYLDSTVQKNNIDLLPNETSKTSAKEPINQKSYAQTAPFNPCELIGSSCTWVKGKINNDCIPRGGPCWEINRLEWLILYYRENEFIKQRQIRLVNLKTDKYLTLIDPKVGREFQFAAINVKSILDTNDPLGLEYFENGKQRNIAINVVK